MSLSGFSKLSFFERIEKLIQRGILSQKEATYLKEGGIQSIRLAENFIENAIGYFQIPLGVATNFVIDGKEYLIPMAVEETSIIAAASKTAKWIKEHGEIQTKMVGKSVIGQIQFACIEKVTAFKKVVSEKSKHWIALANEIAAGLVKRGGGVSEIIVREITRPDRRGTMIVLHILADTCDAMGANIINQICEGLKSPIEKDTGEKVTMCILSNLVDTRLVHAKVILKNIEPELRKAITEASLFSQLDSYRAATNNKGVLNGIDAVTLATGNDWRAVEAGIHAYAARDSKYISITKWYEEGELLIGEFLAPITVGTVGGVTKLHPTAQLSLKILGVNTAEELSRIIAAVGLVQNLGALRALTTIGIVEGHMKLHTSNLALAAGAKEHEQSLVQNHLKKRLASQKKVSLADAEFFLKELRANLYS